MIDLHTHTLLSDGELLPSELARRAEEKGYETIAFTDHIDFSNVEEIIPALVQVSRHINKAGAIKTLPGAEITHVNPEEIGVLAKKARQLGAKIIVVHGETLVEPVTPGTNLKGLESDIDILAHPGLLSEKEAEIAVEKGIAVEISCRQGHCLSNGWVVKMWYKYRFSLVLNTDTHSSTNLITDEFARRAIKAAGVEEKRMEEIFQNSRRLAESKRRKSGIW